MAANETGPEAKTGRGLSADLVEQLRRTYADGNHVNLRALVDTHRLADSDDLVADLIDADGRLRIQMGFEVTLERYLEAVPGLEEERHSASLDTAIEMAIRSQCARGEAHEQAVEALARHYPRLARPIRTAGMLSNVIISTEGLRRSLAAGGRKLPQEFGPALAGGHRRYELRELIGTGAHGSVFLAKDRQLSDRDRPAWVAIKVMAALGPRDEARIVDEATKARRVDHPNVVRVLDRGISEDGEPYLAYEYVRGGDLHALVAGQAGPMPERQAASITARVARGLQAAHSAGLAHCDLKPANVLVTEGGEPKIADFGVAVRLGSNPEQRGPQRLGSMAFMAPEQFRSEPGALSPLADVYAAGGILYWFLTGRYPNGESAQEVERNLAGPAARTDAPSPSAVRPVDRDLDAICSRALHADPRRRYASAEALASDLEAWLRYQPLPWNNPGPMRRMGLLARRQPLTVVLTLALIICLCAAAAGTAYAVQRAAHRELEHRLELADEQARAATERLRDASVVLGGSINALKSWRMSAEEWVPLLTVLETMVGPVFTAGSEGPDLWTPRIAHIGKIIDDARVAGRGEHVEVLMWETALGYWLVRSGDLDRAEALLGENRAKWAHRTGPDDPWLASIDAMKGCIAARRALAEGSRKGMESSAAALADLGPRAGTWEHGRMIYRLVLSVQEELYGPDALDDAASLKRVREALKRIK